jgi:iron complex transport system substrate-binding protein
MTRLIPGLLALMIGASPVIAETPSRVIAAGGSVAEIIHALGASDRLIARDTTATYPETLTALPDIGYVRALSAENLIAMDPDLVIAEHDAGPPEVMDLLRRSGIPLVSVPQALHPDEIADKISAVANALDLPEEGRRLQENVAATIATARAEAADLRQSPKVMFILSLQGGRLMVAGSETSAEAMITLAGGQNAVTGMTGYKPLTDEAAIAAAPDLILMMDRGGDHAVTLADIKAHPALRLTPAGAADQVLVMDGLYLLGFGPRTGDAARDLVAAFARLPTRTDG